MSNKYNYRDKSGKFAKSVSNTKIVAGRLYSWKGITVRAISAANKENAIVSVHKALIGTVPKSELQLLSKDQVLAYLENV
jgi:hypothetical protein